MQPGIFQDWRPVPIPEFQDIYSVSSEGFVRSVDRQTRGVGIRRGRILVNNQLSNGYRTVNLTKTHHGLRKSCSVHRLVAGAFFGPCPPGSQVNHKNGNKSDNRVENLEYVSHRQNMAHAVAHGLYPRGEQVPHHKLTEADVRDIFAGTDNNVVTSRRYHVSHQTVRAIRRRDTWKHLHLHADHEMSPR